MKVTMDRYEADWNIVKRGWEAHVLGQAPNKFTDALTAVKTLRVSWWQRGRMHVCLAVVVAWPVWS